MPGGRTGVVTTGAWLTAARGEEVVGRGTLGSAAVDWDEHAEREEARYADGLARLPADPDGRQKQLVRVAMAATGAGLARLMQGRRAEAAGWLARSAERFRESYSDAPPESWGKPSASAPAPSAAWLAPSASWPAPSAAVPS